MDTLAPLLTEREPGRQWSVPAAQTTPSWSEPLLGELNSQEKVRRSQSEPLLGAVLHKCIECRELPNLDDGELKRGLGSVELTLLGVGACIGSGIFVMTGMEARVAGPSVGLAFCFAAASSVFNGFCYAELSSRLPISGSAYLYAYCMFGELPAMVVVANQLLDYHIGAATISRSIAAYVGEALMATGLPLHECFIECQPNPDWPWFSVSLGAPLVLLGVTSIVAGGAKFSAAVTSVMTVVKLGIVVLVILVGTRMVDMSRWLPFFPYGMSATLQAAATLNYAFVGYDVIANAAEESKNPQRDIPLAIVGALTICAVLYLIVCMVLCGMQTFNEISSAAPLSSAFIAYDMVWVASVINVGAFFGMATGLVAGLYGQSRVYFALARDDLAPSMLKQPNLCASWCGGVAAFLAAFCNLTLLASMLNIGVLLAYSSTAASILRINKARIPSEEKNWREFFKSESFLILSVLALAMLVARGDDIVPGSSRVAGALLVCDILWASFSRTYSSCPSGAFHCPGVPFTPLVAISANVYLGAQLSWHAWARLAVVSVIVTVAVGVLVVRDIESKDERKVAICKTVHAAAKAAGTKPGVCHACEEAAATVPEDKEV